MDTLKGYLPPKQLLDSLVRSKMDPTSSSVKYYGQTGSLPIIVSGTGDLENVKVMLSANGTSTKASVKSSRLDTPGMSNMPRAIVNKYDRIETFDGDTLVSVEEIFEPVLMGPELRQSLRDALSDSVDNLLTGWSEPILENSI